ncbi:MAG: ferredoxin [Dehalococcoidia bacterium]
MKIKLDLAKCTRSGECYYNHPMLFKADKDGWPIQVKEELETDIEKIEAQQAVDACPAELHPLWIED